MTSPRTVQELLDARSPGGDAMVLAFADASYVDVLLNWLVFVDRLGHLDRVTIVALDDALGPWLRNRGFTAPTIAWDGTLGDLWTRRLDVLRELVDAGHGVVLSDIDAVWLSDPLAETDRLLRDHDVVLSQGTVWPPDALAVTGAIGCCGYVGMRPTASTSAFLERVEQRLLTDENPDDQAALNRELAAMGCVWTPTDGWPAVREHEGTTFGISDELVSWHGDGLSAALLPMSRYQRLQLPHPPVVSHHLAAKRGESKLAELERTGALLLRRDWRSIDVRADALHRLLR